MSEFHDLMEYLTSDNETKVTISQPKDGQFVCEMNEIAVTEGSPYKALFAAFKLDEPGSRSLTRDRKPKHQPSEPFRG